MGLAASQARYLTLTARKSDLEFQSQTINSRRIQLSYKTAEIARAYSEAMNNKKIQICTPSITEPGKNIWQELTFSNLLKNGFVIIGSNGAPLHPSPYILEAETTTIHNRQNDNYEGAKGTTKTATYTFKNWNTKADGTGTAYTDEQSVTNLTSEDGAIINLYAIWEKETYSVTFDANGGTGTMENQTFSYGEAQTLNEISFVKEGFKFKNWNTKADGTGTAYSDKQEIGITENLTLYAQWEETYSYRINNYTYDDNKMYISKINIDTTVDEYKSNFTLNVGYTIDVNYKTVNGQNVLYTGSKTKIYNGQNLIKEYTNIVTGDVNGDGKISVLDIIQINNHIIDETKQLGEIYALAGNYNGDTRLSVLDIIQINNYIIGE